MTPLTIKWLMISSCQLEDGRSDKSTSVGSYFNGAGPANSVNVFFYADAATFPGAAVAGGTYMNVPITSGAATGSFVILLPTPLTLAPGTYWVSVQANMDFPVGGQWAWNDRTVQSNSGAAFQNPGGGFACSGGNSWVRKPTCVTGAAPDNIFQLLTPGAIICPPCNTPYTFTTSTGVIVPGTTDVGNHVDDGDTTITLPFPYTLYDQTFTTAHVGSNGHVTFGTEFSSFGVVCPMPEPTATYAIGPYWTDQCTGACNSGGTTPGIGIFTSTSGVAPNRIFNIEYRTVYYNTETTLNYEVRLYEGQKAFDVIYGTINPIGAANDSALAVGVQKNSTAFTQQGCDSTGGTAPPVSTGQLYHYTAAPCPPPPVPTSAVSRKVHGGAGTFDINLPLVPISGAVGIEDRTQGAEALLTMWYNGDFNGVNGLANEKSTTTGQASVYDNFVVTTATGWDVTDVFSDNLLNTNVTGATWEIRSGITPGNGGTLVASGMTLTPTVTATGRSGFGFTEYQVKVSGLNVHLPQLPAGQFYWLNVTPIGDGTGRSFDSDTSGANAVGVPPGNDLNSFWDSTDFGAVFVSTSDPIANQPADFSMGLIHQPIGGGGFNHQMVVTFANPVAVDSVAVTNGTGSVASFSVSGNVVTINLTGVTNAQRLGVTLVNVCDGTNSGNVLIPMGVLAGDTSNNGTVSGTDVSQTKLQSGQAVSASNFREDVNANGAINGTDVSAVKLRSGTSLP